jgi:DNA-binding CsgD family transcriptional regulator
MRSLQTPDRFRKNVLSASRLTDLTRLVQSMSPDLVIIDFRNNQAALNELSTLDIARHIPLICLTSGQDHSSLCWEEEAIVFTFSLEQLSRPLLLNGWINSLFLLHAEPPVTLPSSLAESVRMEDHGMMGNNMSRYILELDQKLEVLQKVKEKIIELYPRVGDPVRSELNAIVNAIKTSVGDQKLWDDFKLMFEQTNPYFLKYLAQRHPQLTPIDLKYCCYLKMNLSNDDIRNLMGISQESVRTHKYRLKRKMELSKDNDLIGYLHSV